MKLLNELRIGNWVQDKSGKKVIVSDIEEGMCINVGRGNEAGPYSSLYYDDMEGIPLTKELLDELDSEPYYNYARGTGKIYYTFDQASPYDLSFIFYPDGSMVLSDNGFSTHGHSFKYVHDLQNIYFALIRRELIIPSLQKILRETQP